jgi:diguanylate cyclase (GGDEF)-like protein
LDLTTPILVLIAVAAGLTAAMTLRMPKSPGRNAFALANLGAVWWIAAVAFRLNSTALDDKVFFAEIAWFGIVAAPLFWSLGLLDYAGVHRAAGYVPKALAFAVCVFAGVAALTNDWHQTLYTGITNYQRPSFSPGWLFYAVLATAYVAMLLASLLALSRLRRSSRLHRRQLTGLLIATLVPLAANAAFNLFGFRLFNDDPTPFAFGVTLAAISFILGRDKLLVAPPIARDVIFAVIPDPILVIDRDGLVLELNPAAERLPGFDADTIGSHLPARHPLAAFAGDGPITGAGTSMITLEEIGQVFEVSRQPLAQWGRDGFVMLVLRNVTQREAALTRLADLSRDLKLRLDDNLRLQHKLKHAALHDHLTGLGNRRHASTAVPPVIAEASETAPVSLIVVDLDYFKQVNDRFGHDVGDRVLTAFAAILKRDPGAGDMAFRHGGEEFLVVLPGQGRDQALARCAQWRRALAAHVLPELDGFALTFSAGIAVAPAAGATLAACTKAADVALYRAKIDGRNRDVVWGEHLDATPAKAQSADTARTNRVA